MLYYWGGLQERGQGKAQIPVSGSGGRRGLRRSQLWPHQKILAESRSSKQLSNQESWWRWNEQDFSLLGVSWAGQKHSVPIWVQHLSSKINSSRFPISVKASWGWEPRHLFLPAPLLSVSHQTLSFLPSKGYYLSPSPGSWPSSGFTVSPELLPQLSLGSPYLQPRGCFQHPGLILPSPAHILPYPTPPDL